MTAVPSMKLCTIPYTEYGKDCNRGANKYLRIIVNISYFYATSKRLIEFLSESGID